MEAIVHIVVYCPECQSRYQLHADLEGRRMRCPNSGCRTTFVVKAAGVVDDADPSSPRKETLAPSTVPRIANAFGEMVPLRKGILEPSEAIPAVTAADEPVEVADWRAAPPPVQSERESLKAEIRRPKSEQAVLGEPTRARSRQESAVTPAIDETSPKRRRSLWVALGLLLLTTGMIGGGTWYVLHALSQGEERLRAEAEADYKIGKYGPAGKKYQSLVEKYGRSSRVAEYRLLADLSNLRDAAGSSESAFELSRKFVETYSRDPVLEPYREDLAQALLATGLDIAQQVDRSLATPTDTAKVDDLLKRGQEALALIDRYPPRDGAEKDLHKTLNRIRNDFSRNQQRKANIQQVLDLLKRPRPDLIAADKIIRAARLTDDAEIVAAVQAARERLRDQVQYTVLNRSPRRAAPADGPSSILLEPYTGSPRSGPGEVVLAVARGLLYALDAREGRRLWVTRVGPDADTLPIRLPGRGDESELVVVAATDPPALTARDLRTGAVRWHQALDAPVLGRPVFDGVGRLFVATAGERGLVYDLDAPSGTLLGHFETAQALAAGAALDLAFGRLYVPAYGQHVYVFNYASPGGGPPRHEGLLPTGHAPGSLRGEPIVVSGEEGVTVPRYLVLGEADGLDAMKLRAFPLLDRADAVAGATEVRVPGWSWFPPYADPEKLALVTDAGAIGLFGIQQTGNPFDKPLFPLLGFDPPAAEGAREPMRALLVHAEEDGFWVLAGGMLQHWRLGLDRRDGLKLAPVWGTGLRLGAPLHAGQVSADRSTLYLITQSTTPAICLATAVDARTRAVKWQRPLGLSCQAEPLPLGDAVVVLDPSGAVFRFEATGTAAANDGWQSGGMQIAKPIPELVGEPQLLRVDGRSAVVFACQRDNGSYRLIVRTIAANGEVMDKTLEPIDSVPAGTAALGPGAIVLPLANGLLCRVPLDAGTRCKLGPNWRARGAKADSLGHVLHWQGDEYLFTDGTRRLARITWPAGGLYERGHEAPLDLRDRLGVPIRLPSQEGEPARAVIADAGGSVTLLRGEVPSVVRTWRVGVVTAGPWAIGDKFAAVVERRKLVWLDPDRDTPVWTFAAPGDGIATRPLFVDGRLVVADLSGQFLALDPATGQALGTGYRHPAVVAPAATPVAFGAGRLFAPLTDGSALLLAIADLVKPKP